MKKYFKQVIQWCIAVILASLIMNFVLGFYNKAAGIIERDQGSTLYIFKPTSELLQCVEGKGKYKVDSRGYLNIKDISDDNYVLVVGASFTQGKEVEVGKRYTDLLNIWSGNDKESCIYNVSQDGYYLPDILQGFSALVSEFPKSKEIIIEIDTTTFDMKQLEKAHNQRGYNPNQTGDKIMSKMTDREKLVMTIKEKSPLLYNIFEKIRITKAQEKGNNERDDKRIDSNKYMSVLDSLFKEINEMYKGKISILYHPSVTINETGRMILNNDKMTYSVFKKACKTNDINFIDVGDNFLKEYNRYHIVPYGFPNTMMGKGHLNKEGHRMIAEELRKVIK